MDLSLTNHTDNPLHLPFGGSAGQIQWWPPRLSLPTSVITHTHTLKAKGNLNQGGFKEDAAKLKPECSEVKASVCECIHIKKQRSGIKSVCTQTAAC